MINLNVDPSPLNSIFKASVLETPIGSLLAVADEGALYLLDFIESRNLERKIEKLQRTMRTTLLPGRNGPIGAVEDELKSYFSGTLKNFKTPLHFWGSFFQKKVWEALTKVPYGQTQSYREQAESMGKQTAYRAVANANGANLFVIIIPCHRIINHNGGLGGYGSGLTRKKWLLDHEARFCK